MSQGSRGPAWKSTSRPPAPHASMLMNARTLLAHLRAPAIMRGGFLRGTEGRLFGAPSQKSIVTLTS
jgi:hypothetical protein